jgi:hypothetical protein
MHDALTEKSRDLMCRLIPRRCVWYRCVGYRCCLRLPEIEVRPIVPHKSCIHTDTDGGDCGASVCETGGEC